MGRIGGASGEVWPLYERIPPLLANGPPERTPPIEGGSLQDLRRIISNAKLFSSKGLELQKPDFLYGDAIADQDTVMSRDRSPWLKLVTGRIMLLPAMPRRYSLLELGQMSVPRLMAEELTPTIDKAIVGRRNRGQSPAPAGQVKLSSALLPGL